VELAPSCLFLSHHVQSPVWKLLRYQISNGSQDWVLWQSDCGSLWMPDSYWQRSSLVTFNMACFRQRHTLYIISICFVRLFHSISAYYHCCICIKISWDMCYNITLFSCKRLSDSDKLLRDTITDSINVILNRLYSCLVSWSYGSNDRYTCRFRVRYYDYWTLIFSFQTYTNTFQSFDK
jgi:hypothetical protein